VEGLDVMTQEDDGCDFEEGVNDVEECYHCNAGYMRA
jgi:hypothetical protein